MALAIAVLIAAVAIGYAMSRVAKIRKELPEIAEKQKRPKRKSKRQKRLEQIRAAEPEYVPPTIEDLVAEEIADLGVDEIPGGDGVAPPVLLKVYKRDTAPDDDCPPAERRYVVANGVDASEAGEQDVRLICVGHHDPGSTSGSGTDRPRGRETSTD